MKILIELDETLRRMAALLVAVFALFDLASGLLGAAVLDWGAEGVWILAWWTRGIALAVAALGCVRGRFSWGWLLATCLVGSVLHTAWPGFDDPTDPQELRRSAARVTLALVQAGFGLHALRRLVARAGAR